MRTSNDQFIGGRLVNGYDYQHQAWVTDGRYVGCGHRDACGCYGKTHAGEESQVSVHGMREDRGGRSE